MGWSRSKTLTMLVFMTLVMIVSAGLAIAFIIYNLPEKEENGQFLRSLTYLAATTFGTGLGCIWFRICQAKSTWFHAMIHSISLGCMLFAHREIFVLLFAGEIVKCYNVYPISMLTICIYTVQFILSFHLILFRYGRTPRQRAFNSGLHAFIGAITLFVCVIDGILVCHKMSKDDYLKDEQMLHLAAVFLFVYGMAAWYIILNPYFDWRRLCHMRRNLFSRVNFYNRSRRI